MFVDDARIWVSGGRGGDGAVSFHREKYRPKGGPDGGNGGRGGSVVLVAGHGVSSLAWLKDHPHQRASPGAPGSGNNRAGASADDLMVPVPVGTRALDESGTLLADLAASGDRFVAASGGRGGRGNAAFLRGSRRAPGFAEKGEPGEERRIRLELHLVADVAVIGYPNSGKSTIVAAVSGAHPKIAEYPFTTLEPNLGVVEVGEERFTICDIPGLIEGAHEGKGLGLKFLRHAERAPVFLHLVDLASGRDPMDDYRKVRKELVSFREELGSRPEMVALNKIDLQTSGDVDSALERFRKEGVDPFPISARDGIGLDPLLTRLMDLVTEARAEQTREGFQLFRTEPDETSVVREGGAWRVRGRKIERWVAMTDLSNTEALGFLQKRLERAGVEQLLAEAGVEEGDEVRIGDAVLEWRPDSAE